MTTHEYKENLNNRIWCSAISIEFWISMKWSTILCFIFHRSSNNLVLNTKIINKLSFGIFGLRYRTSFFIHMSPSMHLLYTKSKSVNCILCWVFFLFRLRFHWLILYLISSKKMNNCIPSSHNSTPAYQQKRKKKKSNNKFITKLFFFSIK